jgi:LuxR family maltose regulon positive regulatory protein
VVETLLATKFYIPPQLSNIVHRQRLLDKLEGGLDQGSRLTLISAAAGYGKTTLLGEWIRRTTLPAAWLALDEGDNDPARFMVYLITALRKIIPECGEKSLDLLASSSAQNPAIFLTPLVNDLAQHPDPFLVVLDDYHMIKKQAVHTALTFLLENVPPQAHFVITSRADPLLPIPRLRGRGQVTEIRQTNLRFTDQEAALFLKTLTGLELRKEDIVALNSRAEGWAAGLRMAAASLQEHPDVSSFIQEFTGSNRYILDYLIEEVLDAQSEAIQGFLLHTSILEQLCGPLCDALTDQVIELPTNSQSILEDLERKNLFILPLDGKRVWYRYHRLFADLLQQRLKSSRPDIESELHRRASLWYEENGLNEFAIDHALLSGDAEHAAQLIENVTESTLMQSQVATYLDWLQQLPPKEVHKRPALSVYYSWVLFWSGAPLEAIEAHLELTAQHSGLSAKTLPLQAFLEVFNGDVKRAADLARQAIEELGQEDRLLRNLASFVLASIYLTEGKSQQGIQILEDTARESERAGNVMIAALVLCELGDESQKLGRLHQANRLYQQALELATNDQGQQLPVAGKALIGLGDIAREWNDFETAEQYLTRGIKLAEQWSVLGSFEGYMNLVVLKDSQGKTEEADQLFSQLRELTYQFDASEIDDFIVDMFAARRNVFYGDLATAQEWAQVRTDTENIAPIGSSEIGDILRSRLRKYENTIVARLFIAQGRYEDAIKLLNQSITEAKKTGRVFLNIDAEILRAIAFQKNQNNAGALAALTIALTLAEPGGFMRVFLDHGDTVKRLLKIARREIDDAKILSYITRLLTAYKDSADHKGVKTSPEKHGFTEPLSDRELDVLQLLPSSLSSTEMAGELSISVNTLRSHLKNIYAKLGAHSRYEAIARAKDAGLL